MNTGRYELHEVLGTGAFATVYRATDPRLDASVAVKVLADNWSSDPNVRGRFRSEAVFLRRVQSEAAVPGIVTVFDIDETDDGRPFMVMSFADRGTLRQRAKESRWSANDVLPIIDAIAETVGALHRAGVVHRDLKPSNLLLRSDSDATGAGNLLQPGERLLVGDLGMAKDAFAETTALSFAGGSARYMAPEQHDVATTVDHRADIHAASVIMTELLCGTNDLPPAGSPMEDRLPDSLPVQLRLVLNRGVATDPADRQESMDEWRSELLSALSDTSHPAAGNTETSRPKRVLATAGAVALAAIIALAAAFGLGQDDGLEITGPTELVVGERATYQLATNQSARWTDWTGAQIESTELQVVATLPGQLTFSAATESEQGQRTVDVIESRLGPTINGPETVRLGQQIVFTATLPANATASYWIGPNGERSDTPDFRFTPTSTGDTTISLVSLDADGIERGSRQTVTVEA